MLEGSQAGSQNIPLFQKSPSLSTWGQGQFTEPHNPCAAQLGGSCSPAPSPAPAALSPPPRGSWGGTCRSVFPRREVWDKSGGRASSCPGSLLTHRHIPDSVPLWNPNLPLLESPMAPAAGRSLSPPPWGRVVPLAQDRPPRGAGREGVAQGTSCLARSLSQGLPRCHLKAWAGQCRG